MADLNLRDIEETLIIALKAEAAAKRITLKQLCVELLQRSDHQMPVPITELRTVIGRPGQPAPTPEPVFPIQLGVSTKPGPRCPQGHGALIKDEQTGAWVCRMVKCRFTTTDEQVELQRETADYNY
jgi:hypothetical protein